MAELRNARILSTGMAVPNRIVPNSYFDEILGENVSEWLEDNLTIKERRWLSEGESVADLIESAALTILAKAKVKPEELDLIIISTDTPEYISPSTASIIQDRLSATGAGTFDLNAACAGFVTSIDMGAKYIQADPKYKYILVIGAYGMSRYLDLYDKKTVTLFADGASGVLLGADPEGVGHLQGLLYTEGQYADWMGIYAGGVKTPVTQEVLGNKDHLLKFVKKFPKELNPITWERMIRKVVADGGHDLSSVKQVFFTQININSIRATMEALHLPMEKAQTIMSYYGYTGSACIPMALNEAHNQGKLDRGDLIVFMGSGGGLAFACSAWIW
ncbi:MAG: ketoacyl-ACP synthase III [Candidatus Marinimicrobia bacterium]|nr:ketoacyl-ACP synthase III [FCB group bacterium]MBL7024644.1 ketoacyl-ACP synthase III [Candidatus Neomarinimicrobiota bacterium]